MFVLALALAATPVADQAARTATIATADLDLSQEAGQRRFERRVAAATEKACGSYAHARDGEEDRISACRASVAAQVAAARQGQLAHR